MSADMLHTLEAQELKSWPRKQLPDITYTVFLSLTLQILEQYLNYVKTASFHSHSNLFFTVHPVIQCL